MTMTTHALIVLCMFEIVSGLTFEGCLSRVVASVSVSSWLTSLGHSCMSYIYNRTHSVTEDHPRYMDKNDITQYIYDITAQHLLPNVQRSTLQQDGPWSTTFP